MRAVGYVALAFALSGAFACSSASSQRLADFLPDERTSYSVRYRVEQPSVSGTVLTWRQSNSVRRFDVRWADASAYAFELQTEFSDRNVAGSYDGCQWKPLAPRDADVDCQLVINVPDDLVSRVTAMVNSALLAGRPTPAGDIAGRSAECVQLRSSEDNVSPAREICVAREGVRVPLRIDLGSIKLTAVEVNADIQPLATPGDTIPIRDGDGVYGRDQLGLPEAFNVER